MPFIELQFSYVRTAVYSIVIAIASEFIAIGAASLSKVLEIQTLRLQLFPQTLENWAQDEI